MFGKKKGVKGQQPDPSSTSTGTLLNKPSKGWIHPDCQLKPDAGVCYGVRYIGCLEVKSSMRSLDFETRTAVARESIYRVCSAAGLTTGARKKKADKKISRLLGDTPYMKFAGSNVNLTITTEKILVFSMESGEVIADHSMPTISFASGGDPDTIDFVSYVAKDLQQGRSCHVFECGGGLAQDVIQTVGQAFELRYKQHLEHKPPAFQAPDRLDNPVFTGGGGLWGDDEEEEEEEHNYVNKPGPMGDTSGLEGATGGAELYQFPTSNLPVSPSDPAPIPGNDHLYSDGPDPFEQPNKVALPPLEPLPPSPPRLYASAEDHEFQVDTPTAPVPKPRVAVDLAKFASNISAFSPPNGTAAPAAKFPVPPEEDWYHGPLSRRQAEEILRGDGEFLVRESTSSAGQYVLTGMQGGLARHLLLVDPSGVVRTKDRTFDSVSHLINFHHDNRLPIISQDSELLLLTPVTRY